jgi:predicted metal-dependent hydrolase
VETIEYRIRRSDRARRVRVTVDAGGVEVVLPQRAPERAAAAAVRELSPWIHRRIDELERARQAVEARGDTLPYLDETLSVREEPGRARVHRRGDVLLVPAGPQRSAALERFYRRAAREEIEPRLALACQQAGHRLHSLTIRGQKTRWASCSRNGAMSFNWRLLLAPDAILTYVIWHEVCHLDVMDHSERFWRLLAGRCPDYRAQSAWLRRHGRTLVLA